MICIPEMKNEIEKIRVKLNELEMSLETESSDNISRRFLEIGFIANSSGNKLSSPDSNFYGETDEFDDDFDDELDDDFDSSFEEDFYSGLDDDIPEDFDEEDLL